MKRRMWLSRRDCAEPGTDLSQTASSLTSTSPNYPCMEAIDLDAVDEKCTINRNSLILLVIY